MAEIVIRPFCADDTPRVRAICFRTARHGRPMNAAFDDALLVSETLAGGYLRVEPEHAYVAEIGGIVSGYLTGCFDTVRFRRACAVGLFPRLAALFLLRGHAFHSGSWRFARAAIRYGRRTASAAAPFLRDYPAHLHVNLDDVCRGLGVCARLLERFLDALTRADIPGVHVSVASDGGARFFAKAGFRDLATFTAPAVPDGEPLAARIMGRGAAGGGGTCVSASRGV